MRNCGARANVQFQPFARESGLHGIRRNRPRHYQRRARRMYHSAHRVDAYVKALWDLAQSLPEYRANTTLIFLPDHGRGKAPHKWMGHGQKIPDSKYI